MPAAPARRASSRRPTPARRSRPPGPARPPTATVPTAPSRPRTSVPDREAAAPRFDAAHRRGVAVLDALLQGRGWIALLFVLLGGIVFFNVDLLRTNSEIAATAAAAGDMKRDNARLRSLTGRLGSSERIQRVAAEAGLMLPAPGDVRYLRSNPSVDAGNAARRLKQWGAPPELAAVPLAPDAVEPVPVLEDIASPVDSVTGAPVDPATGATLDPAAGAAIDPATGAPVDPATGATLDPATGSPAG